MARRAWVIGAAGVVVVALASTTSSFGGTAANPAVTSSPLSGAATITSPPPSRPITEPAVVTEPAPTEPSSTSSTSTSSSSTTTTTTTTMPAYNGPFDDKAFDDVVATATVAHGDIAAGVAVMRNGEVLHTAAFGMENPFESKPATTRTRFRIASVSKMLTAVAIMQFVEAGSIELDQAFAGQLGLDGPFADPRVGTVTVRQLMSHTSGFAASRGIFFGHGVDSWQQAASNAFGQVLQFDPGTAFQYSNTNYCLLGLLVESVTGQSFETAIRQRVLEPIGAKAHLAPTFDTQAGDALHASATGRNYMEALGPAGGWVATPLDVAKLASALRLAEIAPTDGALVGKPSVDAMRVPVPVPVEDPPPLNGWSYGLGLILFGDGSWGHTGTIESTHAIVVNRTDGLTVSVLVSGKVPDSTDDLVGVIDLAVAAATAP
ncbi:MAG: serine hydrolase domain-containing protein [Ilumatobacteraceae bacterium]